ncbi:MAG: phosphatase PAP2 family protein [Oscillospiraceae bacterium]|nr:phosphatase PAP2 family protein [Oscillospiraceae bacterium]
MLSEIRKLDDLILNYIQNNLRFSVLDKIMPVVSRTGNDGAIWLVIAFLLFLSRRHREAGFMLVVSLAVCVIIGNLTLKPLVARRRPCAMHPGVKLLIPMPKDHSFPSGHTMSSFAAATILFMADKGWGILGFALAALIAYSRLYLYVHYPSDVLCGMICGVLIAFVTVKLVILLFRYGYRRLQLIREYGGLS